MYKLRMKGEGTHRIVGIGVLPGVRHGGVVNGQELYYVLSGFDGPVHQVLDIVEFPYAEAFFAAQREHRNGHAGSAPGLCREAGLQIGDDELGVFGRNLCEEVVGPFFPQADFPGLGVHDYEFVFHGFRDVQGDEPPREALVRHQVDVFPVPQEFTGAHDAHGFVTPHFRHGDADADVPQVWRLDLFFAER